MHVRSPRARFYGHAKLPDRFGHGFLVPEPRDGWYAPRLSVLEKRLPKELRDELVLRRAARVEARRGPRT